MHYIVLCSAVVIFRKRRLDEICLERFQQYSRTFIQSWILQGQRYSLIAYDLLWLKPRRLPTHYQKTNEINSHQIFATSQQFKHFIFQMLRHKKKKKLRHGLGCSVGIILHLCIFKFSDLISVYFVFAIIFWKKTSILHSFCLPSGVSRVDVNSECFYIVSNCMTWVLQ